MTFLSFDPWLSKKLNKKTYFLNEKFISKFLKYDNEKKSIYLYENKKQKFISYFKKKKFRFITTNIQCKKKFLNYTIMIETAHLQFKKI